MKLYSRMANVIVSRRVVDRGIGYTLRVRYATCAPRQRACGLAVLLTVVAAAPVTGSPAVADNPRGHPPVHRVVGATPGPPDSTGAVAAALVDAASGEPIPYGTVTLGGTGHESFADARGRFRFTGLPLGTYHLQARQIGYSPRDTTIVLTAIATSVDATLKMQRIPLRLPIVAVLGAQARGCVTPGAPDSAADPALATVFAQMRENADRFRLLVDEYPFHYRRKETFIVRTDSAGRDSTISVDTTEYESRARRPYRVGEVTYVDTDAHGHRVRHMWLSTFRDLADSIFLAARCFRYNGTEDLGTRHTDPALRIDFRPADTIRAPDVAGSIYLDSTNLLVRRAVFHLVNFRALGLPVLDLTVTTTYREVVPLVPVIDSVVTYEPLAPKAGAVDGIFSDAQRAQQVQIEQARLLDYTFEGRTPGQIDQRLPAESLAAVGISAATLSPVAQPGVPTLKGRVLEPGGAPVPVAVVGLIGTANTVTTDDSGSFLIHATAPGAYVLSVLRLGYEPERLAVTLSPQRVSDITVTLTRVVPVLPTVTTTAAERAAYHDVGFEQRMRAGLGFFLTYDKILKKRATQFTDLLREVPGLKVTYAGFPARAFVSGTRGLPNCVSYVVDGSELNVGTESADYLIGARDIGAIEVYAPSERPTMWGAVGAASGTDECMLVVIWTRTLLGLSLAAPSAANDTATGRDHVIRGVPAFDSGSQCVPPAATDTLDFPIYAILRGAPSLPMPKAAWMAYSDSVLSVVDRLSVLPTELMLPSFGIPFVRGPEGNSARAHGGERLVSPALSTVIVFTLDSSGGLAGARVAASSLSGAADTAVLAMLQRAAGAHALPAPPSLAGAAASAQFNLVVTSIQPAAGTRAAVLGQLEAPVWRLSSAARLAPGPQPGDSTRTLGRPVTSDSATVEMVVDALGRVARGTARGIGAPVGMRSGEVEAGYAGRIAQTLSGLRFEPARIGGCPVSQLVIQSVAVPRREPSAQ